jgi:hypothetical protein
VEAVLSRWYYGHIHQEMSLAHIVANSNLTSLLPNFKTLNIDHARLHNVINWTPSALFTKITTDILVITKNDYYLKNKDESEVPMGAHVR